MSSILVVSGRNRGCHLVLDRRPAIAGREEACALQVLDELVSRRHFEVRYEETHGRYRLIDLHSANGVYLNGRVVDDSALLRDGDVIEIGNAKLLYTDEDLFDGAPGLDAFRHRGQRGRSTLVERESWRPPASEGETISGAA